MQVYFEPDRKWWQVWKRNRFLVENKDYVVSHGRFILNKPLKGKMEVSYEVNL